MEKIIKRRIANIEIKYEDVDPLKQGQKIIDTHLGSGSSAIAAHYYGVDFVGLELDSDYFDAAKNRFDLQTRQQDLF